MCILEKMQEFAANGIRVFGKASKGQFHSESEAVKAIKKEMIERTSDRCDDIESLLQDKKKVKADIRKSFNNLILING